MPGLGGGQQQVHAQPGVAVAGPDPPLVQLHGAPGDGQAQAEAVALGRVQALVGLEDALQVLFGDPWSLVFQAQVPICLLYTSPSPRDS